MKKQLLVFGVISSLFMGNTALAAPTYNITSHTAAPSAVVDVNTTAIEANILSLTTKDSEVSDNAAGITANAADIALNVPYTGADTDVTLGDHSLSAMALNADGIGLGSVTTTVDNIISVNTKHNTADMFYGLGTDNALFTIDGVGSITTVQGSNTNGGHLTIAGDSSFAGDMEMATGGTFTFAGNAGIYSDITTTAYVDVPYVYANRGDMGVGTTGADAAVDVVFSWYNTNSGSYWAGIDVSEDQFEINRTNADGDDFIMDNTGAITIADLAVDVFTGVLKFTSGIVQIGDATTTANSHAKAIAIGSGAEIAAPGAIAIGESALAGTWKIDHFREDAIAIGTDSLAIGENSVAIGTNATTSTNNTFVIGANAAATVDEADTFYVGGDLTKVKFDTSLVAGSSTDYMRYGSSTGYLELVSETADPIVEFYGDSTGDYSLGMDSVTQNFRMVPGYTITDVTGLNLSMDGDFGIGIEASSSYKLNVNGNTNVVGNITATNLSGTNTGDQNISGISTNATNIALKADIESPTFTTAMGLTSTSTPIYTLYNSTLSDDGGRTSQIIFDGRGNAFTPERSSLAAIEVNHDGTTTNQEGRFVIQVNTGSALATAFQIDSNYGIAMGAGTTASGHSSMAMNNGTTASGNYSVAMGYQSAATDHYAMAMGTSTVASAPNSTAFGRNTTASGNEAIAMGREITVSGVNSVGIGLDATARTVSQSNTLAIMGGTVGIGTIAPTETLDIVGNIAVSGTVDEVDVGALSASVTTNATAIDTKIDGVGSSQDKGIVRFDGTTGKISDASGFARINDGSSFYTGNITPMDVETITAFYAAAATGTRNFFRFENTEYSKVITLDYQGNLITDGTIDGVDVSTLSSSVSTNATAIDTKITGVASSYDKGVVRFDGFTGKIADSSGFAKVTDSDAFITGNVSPLDVEDVTAFYNITSSGASLDFFNFANDTESSSVRLTKEGNLSITGTVDNVDVSALASTVSTNTSNISTNTTALTNTPTISSGTVVPSSTPAKVGDIYIDTTNKKLYFATGISTSADWTIAN